VDEDPRNGGSTLGAVLDGPRSGSHGRAATAAERPLDLHEGIAHVEEEAASGCERWPEPLWLLASTGEVVQGRCRATKKCPYCGRLGAVENAEMVALDAVENAPTLFVVLTTRDPAISGCEVRRHLERTWRAVRRRWPSAEYACFVEFTTGLSVWSGGHRRIHLNLLTKGVPESDRDELHALLLRTWGARTSTTQLHVGPVYAAEGLVRYVTNLALHVMKDGQKPPPTYEGHLIRWSRGYFASGATEQRSRARAALRLKRELWKLLDHHPDVPADVIEELAADRLAAAAETSWRLVYRPGRPLAPNYDRRMREAARAPFLGRESP